MPTTMHSLFNRGIYGVAEAARMVRLPEARVRRWVRGYRASDAGGRRWMPPLVGLAGEHTQQGQSLSFQDLLEVLYLEHFVSKGVTVQMLRRVSERAKTVLSCRYPFSTHRFVTDGRAVLQDVSEELRYPALLNLISEQLEEQRILATALRGDLDLDELNQVTRWWPLTKSRDVVVDPRRRFGAPISNETGLPTALLARSYAAEGSYRRVGTWYEVPWRSVRDAVAFERSLAA